MSEYLESLKADLAQAQKRLQDAQVEAQRINVIFQNAHADVQALQRIVDNQLRKEQQPAAAANGIAGGEEAQNVIASAEPQGEVPELNKSKLIRETLRQHAGMTPGEVFDVVKAHVGRAYVYSVLKRMRDNNQVIIRRKKYYLNPEEVKTEALN
jgi:hypothetical protein